MSNKSTFLSQMGFLQACSLSLGNWNCVHHKTAQCILKCWHFIFNWNQTEIIHWGIRKQSRILIEINRGQTEIFFSVIKATTVEGCQSSCPNLRLSPGLHSVERTHFMRVEWEVIFGWTQQMKSKKWKTPRCFYF